MTVAARPVIVTGDDFGLNRQVNLAIAEAHRSGVLGSASLMMTGDAVGQAVAIARDMPDLRVGLHLAVTRSRALLAKSEVASIVDDRGMLGGNLLRTSLRYSVSRSARAELAREIRAQFEAFAATRLPLDHVDVHNHMHLHPTVLSLLLAIGRDYGLKAVRLPYEPFAPAWRAFGGGPWRLGLSWLCLMPWTTLMKRRLKARHILCNDHLFGMSHTGRLTKAALARVLRHLPAAGLAEVHLHPGLATTGTDGELDALTDPAIRDLFERLGLRVTSYGAEIGAPARGPA